MSKRRGKRVPNKAPRSPQSKQSGWYGAWDRLSDRWQHLVCLLFLLAVSLGFFGPMHFSGKTLIGGDIVQWRAMAEETIRYEQETGREALWAPNAFAGMPAYMINYTTEIPQVDSVVTLLRRVIWPTSHFLVLLLGVYLLLVLLTRDKLAGVLAACAFGLTTYLSVILVAGHNSKFIALAFAPWLVLAFAYALRHPRLLSGLLFAIAVAVHLRAGHVQITYYVLFLLGIWWIVEGVGALRHGRLRPFGAATGYLALGAVLGLLMVAQPYLAHAEYKDFTIRGAGTAGAEGGLGWAYAMNWSQGWGELITLALADAYGGGGASYWGEKPFTAGPHYIGGIALLLAALALWQVRRNVVWGLGIGALLMTLFAVGENFPLLNRLMFEYFPLFSAFRVPETWLSVVVLAVAVLAGFGLHYAARREPLPEAETAKTQAVYLTTGTAIGVVLLLLLFRGVFFDFERPSESEEVVVQTIAQQVAAGNNVSPVDPRVQEAARQYYVSEVLPQIRQVQEQRAATFGSEALRALIFLLLGGLVLVLHRRGVLPAWTMQAALALLVVVDLWGVDRRYFSEDVLVEARDAEEEITAYDFDRYLVDRRQAAGGLGHFRVLSLEQGSAVQAMAAARPAYFYETLGGYHGAKLRLYQDFIDHILVDEETGLPNENALDLLNTRYVVAREPLPDTEVAYQGEETGWLVLENPDALPRAFFVGETEVIASAEETWERLQSETFDPAQTAILPEPIPFETTPIDSASVAEAELERYAPRELVWRVRTDAPRLLVLSEVYYPAGWRAELDGEEVPILRADYLLRAVPVPEGEHTLVLRFEPRAHTLGLWISGISTALVYGVALVLIGLALYRRTKEEPHEHEETVS